MKLKKYLKYNNIALIDPSNEFHQSCIGFYKTHGYLSVKQVQALRNYVHSPDSIQRLTGKTPVDEPKKAKLTSSADAFKNPF